MPARPSRSRTTPICWRSGVWWARVPRASSKRARTSSGCTWAAEARMELFLQQVLNGLMIGSTYAVVALGFSLVFSVMRVVNMAHPEFFMAGAFGAFLTITHVTRNVVGVLVGGMAVALGVGLVVERLAIRPVRGRYVMIPFIATSGVGLALQHGAERLFGSDPVLVPTVIPSVSYSLGPLSVTRMQLVTLGTAAVLMLALRYYVRNTKWGRATRAVAERPDVAAAFGVDVNFVSRLTVGISALMRSEERRVGK